MQWMRSDGQQDVFDRSNHLLAEEELLIRTFSDGKAFEFEVLGGFEQVVDVFVVYFHVGAGEEVLFGGGALDFVEDVFEC